MMKTNGLKLLCFALISALMVGCAATQPQQDFPLFNVNDLNAKVQSGEFTQKVDNFLIILDASGSMADEYAGRPKLDMGLDIASRLIQTVPKLELTGGLRTFGHSSLQSPERTAMLYAPTKFYNSRFNKNLEKVKYAGGNSPLGYAIDAATEDFRSMEGDIALIIISDGKSTDFPPQGAAERLKYEYGDRVCIYTIQIGDDAAGGKLLENVAAIGKCGTAVAANDIATGQGMADFVTTVFLTKAIDSDGDGVPDHLDQCPNTPAGVAVDSKGCPLDSDGDGVPDYLDQCPNTPAGVTVDSRGCPLDSDGDGVPDYRDQCPGTPQGAAVNEVGCWVLGHVLFDFDKAILRPEGFPIIDEAITVLKNNPGMRVELQGHCDIRGTRQYNQTLSEKRADAVRAYMVDMGIAPDRLSTIGFGFDRPVDTNETDEGRQKNRRVQIMPLK